MSKTTTRNAAAKRKHDEMNGSPAPPSQQVARGWQNPPSTHNSDTALYQGFSPAGVTSNPQSAQQYYSQYYNLRPSAQMPPQPAQAPTPPTRTNTRSTGQKPTGKDKESGLDRQNVNQLNDALAAGGVSLREEEEYASASRRNIAQSKYQGEDRTKKQDFLDISTLTPAMEAIATGHGVQNVSPEAADYLALALRARLSGLIEGMSKASKHRWAGDANSTPTLYEDGKTPIFERVVRRDVGKQLQLLEKIEKDEELRLRRERKERESKIRAAMSTTGTIVDGDDDDDGPPKKKKKKADGPGVTAKNMSEETKKKLSNSIANQAAGFMGKYSWMHSGSASLPARPRPTKNSNSGTGSAANAPSPTAGGSGWARPYVPSKLSKQLKAAESKREITIRDALFVVERERGHGGGRGAARGWAV